MALSKDELAILKSRCLQAQTTGFAIGKADVYLAELMAELGGTSTQKPTTEALLFCIRLVEAKRAGQDVDLPKPEPKAAPIKVPAPAPVQEPEPEPEPEEPSAPTRPSEKKSSSSGSKKKPGKK